MVISLFTTQDKEKLQELQEIVTAFKTIFPITDLTPDLRFKGANDLFLKEFGIKRLDLRNTLPTDIMSAMSVSRLQKSAVLKEEMTSELELDTVSREGKQRTYQSALIKMNGSMKKSMLVFKSWK